MNEKPYCVYMHTSPSGKVYIGITGRQPEIRWRHDGSGYAENEYFMRAIKKYGWKNIAHEVLESGLTHGEALQREIELIKKCSSNDLQCGYNLTSGGDGNAKKRSEATLKKMSEASRGNKHALGHICTAESRAKISRSLIGQKRALGNRHTQKAKDAISAAHKGKALTPEHRAAISGANKGKSKSGSGAKGRATQKMSKEGEILFVFRSQTAAAEHEGGGVSASRKISECCTGKRSCWHGFIWKYAEVIAA